MKNINKIFWSALILLVVYTILVLVPTPVNFSITGFVAEGRLPTIGGDSGNWGSVLNTYLTQEHTAEGGHKNVTVQGSLNVTGNLTIGDKITFRLGEVIDNIVDGIIRVTGNLNVVGDLNVSGEINSTGLNVAGNGNFTGNLTVSGSVGSGTPDANTLYAKSLPKAWVSFQGTTCSGSSGSCTTNSCTILGSFNVECVDRTSLGNYKVFWDRDFADTNYVIFATVGLTPGNVIVAGAINEGNISIRSHNSANSQADAGVFMVIAFGEQ